MSFLAAPVFHTLFPRTAALHTAMRTRIACYFDVPRADSRADFANYVDIDLKPTDSKNELKKKVAKKVGIPFDRLKMRLGPFNEVHMFDKEGRIKVSSSGHTVAMKDRRLPTAVQDNNFGAADHELPEWTPEGMGHHPFSDWKQKFEDLEQF
mmetsp:Transcript_33323/g.53362  ORF Transcript_33323/g.53362 Transcript_33323/m.53362 type:complete len:152 (-) Transcript_33323:114-569(-)